MKLLQRGQTQAFKSSNDHLISNPCTEKLQVKLSDMGSWDPFRPISWGPIKTKSTSKSKNKLQKHFPKILKQLEVVWA